MGATNQLNQKSTYNICDTGIGTATKDDDTNHENESVDCNQWEVLLLVPLALLEELEPHPCREVEGETGDEQAGADGEQVREEGNGLRNDPGENGDDSNEREPSDPTHFGVDEADDTVLVVAAVDVARQNGRIDGARNKNDGQGQTEGDLAEQGTGGQKCGRLDGAADKHVDQSAGDGVDEDFNDAEGPNRPDKVLGSVHFVHEGELADGEGVGENDVAESNKSLHECQTLLGPGRPVGLGNRAVVRLNASSDNGDQNGDDNGREIDVAQNGDLGKGRGDGQQHEDDSRGDSKDDRAGSVIRNVSKGDGTGQSVGSDQKEQLETEHDTDEFIAEFAHEKLTGIRVVGDVWELELDLTDNIGRVNCDHTNTDTEDDTGNHAEAGKCRGDRERAQGDGLDNQDDSETFPAQPVEFVVTISGFPLLQVGPICDLANSLVLAENAG